MFELLWFIEFQPRPLGNASQKIRLAGMRKPTSDADVQSLKDNHVTGIISLLDDTENHDLYQQSEMDYLWLAVKSGTAPSREQVEAANAYITKKHQENAEENTEGIIATHCSGGRKRTGTLLAGVMVLNGISPDEAINTVETANPDITLSDTQVAFLHSLSETSSS